MAERPQRRDPPPTAPVMPKQYGTWTSSPTSKKLREVFASNRARVELVRKSWRIPWRWFRKRDPQIDDVGVYM